MLKCSLRSCLANFNGDFLDFNPEYWITYDSHSVDVDFKVPVIRLMVVFSWAPLRFTLFGY